MTPHRLQTFRVQFLGPRSDGTANVVEEQTVFAADLTDAAREVANVDWPLWARSYRILDLDGQEVAHVFKLDP